MNFPPWPVPCGGGQHEYCKDQKMQPAERLRQALVIQQGSAKSRQPAETAPHTQRRGSSKKPFFASGSFTICMRCLECSPTRVSVVGPGQLHGVDRSLPNVCAQALHLSALLFVGRRDMHAGL